MDTRTVGVEEEMLVVDPKSGRCVPLAADVLDHAPTARTDSQPSVVEAELMRQQVEMQTEPCSSLDELRASLVHERARVARIAASQGLAIAPLATSPFPVEPVTTPDPRYERLVERFGPTAARQLACGCHVHVSVTSAEEGVGVLDRIGPWLPMLLAVSANSPYWQGEDTGYASYRSQVWSRWPSAGPTETFGSVETYEKAVRQLIDSGGALDRAAVYFDARLSAQHPTVELRVADVCLDPDDAVLIAGLGRALVDWAAAEWAGGRPGAGTRAELLRAASWRAARWGMCGELLDPQGHQLVAAAELLDRFAELLAPALSAYGDEPIVARLIKQVLARGTGSERQRAATAQRGRLEDAVTLAVAQTTDVG